MDGRSIDVMIGGDVRLGIIGVRICRMHEVSMRSNVLSESTCPLFRKGEYSVTSCQEQLHPLSNSLPLFIFFRGHFHLNRLRRRGRLGLGSLDRYFTFPLMGADGSDTPVRPI